MLRGIWQSIKSYFIPTELSQEEIDIQIESELSEWGEVVYDPDDIEPSFKARKRTFLSHKDAIKYISEGGIPASAVQILVIPNADDEGNTFYQVWVSDDTP